MYSLDINFLKDPTRKPEEAVTPVSRKTAPTMGSMVPMVGGGVIAAILIGLPFLGLFWLNTKKTEVTDQITKLEAEIKKAEEQGAEITRLQGEYDQVKLQTDAFVDIFNKIQPISAIFQDLLDNVPQGVQIDSVAQTETKAPDGTSSQKLAIDGIAASYDQANDFLLTLKRSGFFETDQIYLTSVSLMENPSANLIDEIPKNLIVEFPQVVKYNISATIKVRQASEILDELTKKGSLGLVSRIKILQEKGVIAK